MKSKQIEDLQVIQTGVLFKFWNKLEKRIANT